MQQNIYFRKNVWERLKHEPDKSKLINELLSMHYEGEIHAVEEIKEIISEPIPSLPKIIKTVKDIPVEQFSGFIDKKYSSRKKNES